MQAKRQIYFERGALEVWLCDAEGKLTFFNSAGELARSALFPDFPTQLER